MYNFTFEMQENKFKENQFLFTYFFFCFILLYVAFYKVVLNYGNEINKQTYKIIFENATAHFLITELISTFV